MDILIGVWFIAPAERLPLVPSAEKTQQQERHCLPMSTLALSLYEYVQEKLAPAWPVVVRVTFGAFIGCLVLLLILTYANVPIIGGV